jgi:hypothetical protein
MGSIGFSIRDRSWNHLARSVIPIFQWDFDIGMEGAWHTFNHTALNCETTELPQPKPVWTRVKGPRWSNWNYAIALNSHPTQPTAVKHVMLH